MSVMNQIGNDKMTSQINVRIAKEVKDELERLAAKDRRKTSDFIRLILEDYVKQHKGD